MRFKYLVFILAVISMNKVIAQKSYNLKTVTVTADRKVDTVFGTWKFSVEDYEFYENKVVLLTFEKNLEHAKVMLADASQKILSSFVLPDEAQYLYKDYLGDINVICVNHIYRVKIKNNEIHLASLPVNDYRNFIMPCIDTIDRDIYFSDYQTDYPECTYYAYNPVNKIVTPFKTVCDKEELQGYNMEYYFLKPKQKLECRKLADEYHIDKHRIAATMSGLTTSMFYTPLYAPLFILKDTVFVFDHYNNAIIKYDKHQRKADSVCISYHHPKNWHDWKHKIIVDKETKKVYALYQTGGYYYLKHINTNTGKVVDSFKLTNQYVKKIKVKNDEVYYVYHPFESLQEQFIYKELIKSSNSLE